MQSLFYGENPLNSTICFLPFMYQKRYSWNTASQMIQFWHEFIFENIIKRNLVSSVTKWLQMKRKQNFCEEYHDINLFKKLKCLITHIWFRSDIMCAIKITLFYSTHFTRTVNSIFMQNLTWYYILPYSA